MEFVPRAQWGAAKSRGSSGDFPGSDADGVVLHWVGPGISKGKTWDHSLCAGKVRGIQGFHQNDRGWSDIAYNFVVCPHGYVYEGRGLSVRSAANGGTTQNAQYAAVCALVGEGDVHPDALFDGLADAVAYCVKNVPAKAVYRTHNDVRPDPTSCPGPKITAWVRNGCKRVTKTANPLKPKVAIKWVSTRKIRWAAGVGVVPGTPVIVNHKQVRRVQKALVCEGVLAAKHVTGNWTPATTRAYRKFQESLGYRGLDADGIPGRVSLNELGKRHGLRVIA